MELLSCCDADCFHSKSRQLQAVDRQANCDYDSLVQADFAALTDVVDFSAFASGKVQPAKANSRFFVCRLRSQVAKAADCKSVIVGSTPTGAFEQNPSFNEGFCFFDGSRSTHQFVNAVQISPRFQNRLAVAKHRISAVFAFLEST
jgi:hypothetical protein